jgi:hypothetical protein
LAVQRGKIAGFCLINPPDLARKVDFIISSASLHLTENLKFVFILKKNYFLGLVDREKDHAEHSLAFESNWPDFGLKVDFMIFQRLPFI